MQVSRLSPGATGHPKVCKAEWKQALVDSGGEGGMPQLLEGPSCHQTLGRTRPRVFYVPCESLEREP